MDRDSVESVGANSNASSPATGGKYNGFAVDGTAKNRSSVSDDTEYYELFDNMPVTFLRQLSDDADLNYPSSTAPDEETVGRRSLSNHMTFKEETNSSQVLNEFRLNNFSFVPDHI